MRYLFLGAHTDDIELNCGGTVAKLVAAGHDVHCHTFSHLGRQDLQFEYHMSMDVLNTPCTLTDYPVREFSTRRQEILQYMIDNFKGKFDMVFTHSPDDNHQDHCVVGLESVRAFKDGNLLTYCAPWNRVGQSSSYPYVTRLDYENVKVKVAACMEYRSQANRPYMNEDYLVSQLRASSIGVKDCTYAERFHVAQLVA